MQCPNCGSHSVLRCEAAHMMGTSSGVVGNVQYSGQSDFAKKAAPPTTGFGKGFYALFFGLLMMLVAGPLGIFIGAPVVPFGLALLLIAVIRLPSYFVRKMRWKETWICLQEARLFHPDGRPCRPASGPSPVLVLSVAVALTVGAAHAWAKAYPVEAARLYAKWSKPANHAE